MGNGNVDKISQNYTGMNNIGKKKLIDVAEQFLKIKNIVDEEAIIFDEQNKIKEFENE
jgi:hypothetical protein